MEESEVLRWFSDLNYTLMEFTDPGLFVSFSILFFVAGLIKMTPLRYEKDHNFMTVILIKIRQGIILVFSLLLLLPFAMIFIYDMTMQYEQGDHIGNFKYWFLTILKSKWWLMPVGLLLGWTLRFLKSRYFEPLFSKLSRKLRYQQTEEELNCIEGELSKYQTKQYLPEKYYDLESQVFIGLDEDNKPLYVPRKTWIEVNMQVIGPTRYFKGVLAGVLADQGIRAGDSVFYIAPKIEKFMPHIMFNAAKQTGRKFYYVDLTDKGPGKWGPFLGGTERAALSRLYYAVGLELSGNAGTDYYKTQERKELVNAFGKGRSLKAILQNIDEESASKAYAATTEWASFETYNCKANQGFSIEKALKEDAIVYVQGELNDPVVKMMQKVFIIELVQEAMRCERERSTHLTLFVDECRFLVSKELADALATIVGFDVNIVTMYQSILDLSAPDDTTLNGKALLQSINVNSQLKAIYGGADPETAEWIADLSGEKTISISKFERTDVNEGGGELWNNSRMLGTEQVSLIHSNTVKVLPPGVCALFRPNNIAKIAFTSWVEVNSNEPLEQYLEGLNNRKIKSESIKKEDNKTSVNNDIEDNAKVIKELEEQKTKPKPDTQKPSNKEAKVTDDKATKSPSPTSSTKEEAKKQKNKERKMRQKAKKKAAENKDNKNEKNLGVSIMEEFISNNDGDSDSDILSSLGSEEEI